MQQQIAHFQVLEEIGRGGMGIVYKARDVRLQRYVAIKILPHDLVVIKKNLQRFIHEARTASALNHPNICTIYEVGRSDGIHYIVMELIEGETLREILKQKGCLSEQEVIEIGLKICDALQAAHSKGIIHRDIKPENIMISREGYVKVMDFGLAKLKNNNFKEAVAEEPLLTLDYLANLDESSVSSFMGTIAYLSPEQIEKKSIDERSDIFSLGIVFYELLSGQLPFQSDKNIDILLKILEQKPLALSKLNTKISPKMIMIIDRMLQKEPANRYQHVPALCECLIQLTAQQTRNFGVNPFNKIIQFAFFNKYIIEAAIILIILWLIMLFSTYQKRTDKSGITAKRKKAYPVVASSYYENLPKLSPDGKQIAYVSDASGNFDVWVLTPGHSKAINMTQNYSGEDTDPDWAPDGSAIVFRSERDGGGLFVLSLESREVTQISKFGEQPSWSPDGKQIAFISPNDIDKKNEVYIFERSNKKLIKVLNKNPKLNYADISWSPDGKWLFYILGRGSKTGISAFSLIYQNEIVILDDGHCYKNPLLAKNMQYLYFQSDRGGSSDIWRIKVSLIKDNLKTKSNPDPITIGLGVLDFCLALDSDKIAYSISSKAPLKGRALFGGSSSLWIMNMNSDPNIGFFNAEKLNFGYRLDGDPEFSPDGKWIAFESDRSGKIDIWIAAVSGDSLRRITNDDRTNTGPGWSPDGEWLIYDSGGSNLADLRIISINGGKPNQLFQNEWADWLADWSPDGKKILFTSNRTGNWDVWQVSVDGTGEKQLTTDPGFDFCPRWSPDGSKIAFISSRSGAKNVWLMSTDGTNLRQVTNFENDEIGRTIGWDRNGDKIYFYRRINNVRNIYSIRLDDSYLEKLSYFDHPSHDASDWGGLSVFENKIIFSTATQEGDIWLMEDQ